MKERQNAANRSRIDVHQHVVPPFWAKTLGAHGGDPSGARSGDPSHKVLPRWSPTNAIAMMDSQKIATGMLSLTAPGIVGWKKSERREMARRVNEYTADLVAKRPDRFGNLATLPLPDVDGALAEFGYALDSRRRLFRKIFLSVFLLADCKHFSFGLANELRKHTHASLGLSL
jgi:6-methylsalicylate decarboxylase